VANPDVNAASTDDGAFYRIPLSSGEALATLAALRALDRAFAEGILPDSDLEPGILASAADHIADELPEFSTVRAEALAAALVRAFKATRPVTRARMRTRHAKRPPFPFAARAAC
jgi:hypothetical protein